MSERETVAPETERAREALDLDVLAEEIRRLAYRHYEITARTIGGFKQAVRDAVRAALGATAPQPEMWLVEWEYHGHTYRSEGYRTHLEAVARHTERRAIKGVSRCAIVALSRTPAVPVAPSISVDALESLGMAHVRLTEIARRDMSASPEADAVYVAIKALTPVAPSEPEGQRIEGFAERVEREGDGFDFHTYAWYEANGWTPEAWDARPATLIIHGATGEGSEE